jgi:uroporphyrinogen-III synthase
MPLTHTVAVEAGLARLRNAQPSPNTLLLATSARAIDVLVEAGFGNWIKHHAWAVVGMRTWDRLRSLGADLAVPAAADVSQLITALDGRDKPMLYLAAVDRKRDLEKALPHLKTVEVYTAQALDGFSDEQIAQLKANPPGAALVYSARSASLFANALENAPLFSDLAHTRWLCLSADVATTVSRFFGSHARLEVAREPTEDALLNLL